MNGNHFIQIFLKYDYEQFKRESCPTNLSMEYNNHISCVVCRGRHDLFSGGVLKTIHLT